MICLIDAGIVKKNKGSPQEEDAGFEIRYMDEDHLDRNDGLARDNSPEPSG